ncbi:MAG: NADH:flavin oxidoreductase [bacterium]
MDDSFSYSGLNDLKKDLSKHNIQLPHQEDLDILKQEIKTKGLTIPNALAIHPMEGADANDDGTPSELTKRRYKRFAQGGAGLIWMEAMAVDEGGRANQDQLFLNKENLASFKNLINLVKTEAGTVNAKQQSPYLVAQLTHSGRFGEKNNIIFRDEYLDSAAHLDENYHIMSDRELDELKNDYLQAARLAQKAGFEAVDIKSCHRYLLSEILAAHKREGKYGGSYENRTRFLKEVISDIKEQVDIDLAVRLNIYDAIPYPNGWSTDYTGGMDLKESRRLLNELEQLGVKIINVTASTPYLKPHVNRPYDKGRYQPPEAPLKGAVRLLKLSKFAQDNFSGLVVGTGFSWFRHLAPYAAAGLIKEGWMTMAGFGRQAFAYPDFARDIIDNNKLNQNKVCITCSKCAELKAAGRKSGCVIRDQDIYLPIYRRFKN